MDLLFLIPVFSTFYLFIGFWGIRHRKELNSVLASLSSIVLILISAPTLTVFIHGVWTSGQDIAKLNTIPALLFEAQFKNKENFEKTFGSIDSSQSPIAGHYKSEGDAWALAVIHG